ncbi:MAG: helix-turn-helix transcriptional regulator [Butyrivibrio sp.]|nr:helix-turn-helix transcriptional regulator [Acetatifactor muris]MCM1558509.1 helix-turn-helix transcriptional regulator [Butyrivibrio sp.]
MISYQPFWHTLKEKNISQYDLIKRYGISTGQLDRLRKNNPVSTATIDNLCTILHCNVSDIMEYKSN